MLTCKFTGNLGNKLFELWSLVGLAEKHGHTILYPASDIYQYFDGPFPVGSITGQELKEQSFTHHDWSISEGNEHEYVLTGYRQSEKYWIDCEADLHDRFMFKREFIGHCLSKAKGVFDKDGSICISIRRGDFVGNPTYYQLPINYYLGALFTHFPDWQERPIFICSDDIAYCKVHFGCLPNVTFAEGMTPMEQLCIASYCDNHIISNSTFSWWCAYLSINQMKDNCKVIRPLHNFGEEYRKTHPETDFWPSSRSNWITFDHEGWKLDLRDHTFTIPVKYDHKHRILNTGLSVCMLQRELHTNIVIMEQQHFSFKKFEQYCTYKHFDGHQFHRTRMLNQMALEATTPYVVNYDCDVIIPPLQLWLAAEALRNGTADFVYPYDGRFARVTRAEWWGEITTKLDVGIFGDTVHFGRNGKDMATTSVGGCVFVNRTSFILSGMEHEGMISYAPEDCERWDRWHILGYKVLRIGGKLFHIDHWCGPDSCSRNPHFEANNRELEKIRGMSKKELNNYVMCWPWAIAAINQLVKETPRNYSHSTKY